MAKSYVDLEKSFLSSAKVEVPSRDAGDETWRAFYTRIGCPEKAESYELPATPDSIPDGLVNDEDKTWFAGTAHELGLTGKQAAQMYGQYMRRMAETATQASEIQTKAQIDVQHQIRDDPEIGGSAAEQSVTMARNAVRQLGGQELADYLNETGLGNNLALIKTFVKVGRMMTEDEAIGKAEKPSFVMTPDQARRKKAALMIDKEFIRAWQKPMHPSHKDALQQMREIAEAEVGDEVVIGETRMR